MLPSTKYLLHIFGNIWFIKYKVNKKQEIQALNVNVL